MEIDKTPIVNDEDNDNYCWARYPNGYDTNSSSDWRFQLATKGTSNGIVIPEFPNMMATIMLLAILSVTLVFAQRKMIRNSLLQGEGKRR